MHTKNLGHTSTQTPYHMLPLTLNKPKPVLHTAHARENSLLTQARKKRIITVHPLITTDLW